MSDGSSLDRLKELADLFKQGLLTEDEYNSQKALILSGGREGAGHSDPALPKEIGAYKVLSVIGQGGMGAVYRGRHRTEVIAERQGGDVAIKVMHPQYATNPSFRQRFEREASLGLTLDHPGIVKVHDLVVDSGMLALIMELVEGRELAEVIGQEVGPIPWPRARPVFLGILEAMAYAHDNQVIHRDLKSENVLVYDGDRVKILDFGIAKKLGSTGTKTGTGMGTVNYMAPEQYTDAKSVNHLADIYALGMTLYEMLAGRLPWEYGTTDFAVLKQKAEGELPPPTTFYPDIPDHVVQLIGRATATDPGARPQSVREFIAALDGGGAGHASPRQTVPSDSVQWGQSAPRSRPAATQPSRPRPPQAPMSHAPPPPAPPAPAHYQAPPKKRSSAGLVIGGVVVLGLLGLGVLAAVVIGAGVLKNSSGDASSSSSRSKSSRSSARTQNASLSYETQLVPAGTFQMGAPYHETNRQDDEVPHTVTISRAYYMGTTEVTQGLWRKVMGGNPSHYRGDSRPVETISWTDAVSFANALSRRDGLDPAYSWGSSDWFWDQSADGWRLPTEAEWENAAKAGESYIYSGSNDLNQVGLWTNNRGSSGTGEVATRSPNAHGLYDMTGNVWEWVWDKKGSYPHQHVTDPTGPVRISYTKAGKVERVVRGGSWDEVTKHMRVANRGSLQPGLTGWGKYQHRYGVRLARNAD